MTLTVKMFSARRLACLLATGAALSFTQAASAGVITADTFTFSIAGFNGASGTGYILGSGNTATFGQTSTYAAAGYNGQSYTMSSSEVVGATTTTDYFKITTPVNFLTTTTVNGLTITALQFDIGDANSGIGVATGADALNLASSISAFTSTGNIVYGAANTVFNLAPTVTLTNGGLSFSMAEGVNYGTNAISALAIHEFDFAITYANPAAVTAVPEPASTALFLAGLGLLGFMVVRRKKN